MMRRRSTVDSKFQTYARVVFPIIAPGIIAAGVLSFLNSWNEFMFALVLTACSDCP